MEKQERNDARRQRKLIKAIVLGDANVLAEKDVAVSDDERAQALTMIADGRVADDFFKELIGKIKGPGIDATYAILSGDSFEQRILGYMTIGFDRREQITTGTLEQFLRQYPTPVEFEGKAAEFLEQVKENNPAQKYEEYAEAVRRFKADVYGKKQGYWEQAKVLKAEALEHARKVESERLVAEFLDGKVVIEGSPLRQGEQEYALTLDLLKQVGLAPQREVSVGGVEIALSGAYKVGEKLAAVAYVRFNDEVKVRGYYRDEVSLVWRYLPDYKGVAGDNSYGTGYGAESLVLPTELQKVLAEVAEEPLIELNGINAEFFLLGTAKRVEDGADAGDARAGDETAGDARTAGNARVPEATGVEESNGDYYREVSREPSVNFGERDGKKRAPEGMDVEGSEGPNFRFELLNFPVSATITARQFASFDDKLRYTLAEKTTEEARQVWIMTIEMNAPITSTGLRAEWVSSGDLGTPLYEAAELAGGYGEVDGVHDGYQNMWQGYLSRMPILKRYLYSGKDQNPGFDSSKSVKL